MEYANLKSDTVTRPTKGMLDAMMNAKVGDDVFGLDPTVNALQEKAAKMFGMEAAVYCPSGTMTNQIAINVHTGRLDELICDKLSHVYRAEVGTYAAYSGVAVKLLDGINGKITALQVAESINPTFDWLPNSSLVVLENTANIGGGSYYTVEEIRPIAELCKEKGLKLHLDGARLFNALVESGDDPKEIGKLFDSISLCLSKGLGAPVGSLLLGSQKTITQARRVRKSMGGGMRQAGFIAAAGIYALDHHIERLKEDHHKAKRIGEVLAQKDYVENIRPIQTNIVIFDVKPPLTSEKYIEDLAQKGILASPFGPQTIRFVTHLDFTEEMLEKTLAAI